MQILALAEAIIVKQMNQWKKTKKVKPRVYKRIRTVASAKTPDLCIIP